MLRHAVLQAIGQWNIVSLKPQLDTLVSNANADIADLSAAFSGIAVSHDDALIGLLETVGKNTEASIPARSMALERLAIARPEKAAPLIVDLVAALPVGESAINVSRALLSEKQGSKLMASALANRELRTEVARDILRVLRESGRTDADLENALKTAGKITSRKSLSADERTAILEKAKSVAVAADGERIYRNEQLGCLKCHAIGGSGGLVGPDNYHPTVVATVDGVVFAGVQIQKSEKTITLRTAENKVVEIPVEQIEEQSQGVSLMPEGLVDNLSDDEIAAVVRFLSELGRTPDYTLSKNRLIRSWQVLMPTQESVHQLNRTSFSEAATDNPAFTWASRYSTVSGSLPIDALPVMKVRDVTVTFARSRINVTSPGKIAFKVNSMVGTEIRIDGVPVEQAAEFSPVLDAGIHTVTVTVDTSKRNEPLLMELLSTDGGGNAELTNF